MRRMTNQVRHYAWGSPEAIPRLLGTAPTGEPHAELWLGAHPAAPSTLHSATGAAGPLDAEIAADPHQLLGARPAARFGARLPFLLKVLAAQAPLSLQVHPGPEQAAAGYAAEQEAGVPLAAPHRNYPDPYHKPEMVLALEPFDALCGFRSPKAVLGDLAGLHAPLAALLAADLAAGSEDAGLRTALHRLLTLPQPDREPLLAPLVAELGGRAPAALSPEQAAVLLLAERYPADPGAVAALLLNRVTLQPGQALFLTAGNLHAYLRGTAVEVMAGSDNVLRAGLTTKHVDVAELLRVVDFTAAAVPYVTPSHQAAVVSYEPQVAEFALDVVRPGAGSARLAGGLPRIALVLRGSAELSADSAGHDQAALTLRRGESAFLAAADGPVRVTGDAHLVVARPGAAGTG